MGSLGTERLSGSLKPPGMAAGHGVATGQLSALGSGYCQLQEGFRAETKALSCPELNQGLKADAVKANHSPQT